MLRTIEQVKSQLKRHGITVAEWARTNGHEVGQVRDVLRGRAKGQYGASHAIAVKLGLKDGEIGPLAGPRD